jgi:hypothetical protein
MADAVIIPDSVSRTTPDHVGMSRNSYPLSRSVKYDIEVPISLMIVPKYLCEVIAK